MTFTSCIILVQRDSHLSLFPNLRASRGASVAIAATVKEELAEEDEGDGGVGRGSRKRARG